MLGFGGTGPGRRGSPGSDAAISRAVLVRLLRVILTIVVIVATGTVGYMLIEGWNFLDSLYMTVITLSTVGFTEVHPMSETGRLWTIIYIIGGLVTFGFVTAPLVEIMVESTTRGYFRRRRVKQEIRKLSGHQIVCGYGRVGSQVARELALGGTPFVVIEQDPERVEECASEGYLVVTGEASNDAVLEEAGVRRARGLIAAVDSDADNVFVTLSARKMNPGLRIIARASSDESASKLEMAGADRTISPYSVGARRLAALATQPLVVDFLDIITRGEKGIEFRLEEFEVPENSYLCDRTIGELRIGERTGAMILAIRNKEGNFDTTPNAKDQLRAGDTLIVLGTRSQVNRLERLMHGEKLEE